jgi:DNA-directed RNA polymerase subunit N (RpoN/RPB10)
LTNSQSKDSRVKIQTERARRYGKYLKRFQENGNFDEAEGLDLGVDRRRCFISHHAVEDGRLFDE